MLIPAVLISTFILMAAFVHLVIACYFRTKMSLHVLDTPDENENGLASVLLAIRGCDPGLRKTLIRLLEQDYRNFNIHLIVDHKSDAAWNLVHQVKSEFDLSGRMKIHEMTKPLKTCGLKCSSLLQGLNHIENKTKYLVLLDADVTPHSTWLGQLIAPLKDEKIGVVTGNQWFEPEKATPGSVLRSLWNAGALVPTAILSNPWAGTFAMRMEDVRRARLPKIWRKSIVDDGPIRRALQPLGLSIYFSPSLIMVNREKCTFGYVNRYVTRMLTWSRIYETTFVNTVVHAIITFVFFATAILILAAALKNGDVVPAVLMGTGMLLSSLLTTVAFLVVRNAVAFSIGLRGDSLKRISFMHVIKLILLTPVAQLIYGMSCFRACLTQRIQWRQITYELRGRSQVKMVRYQPWIANEPEKVHSEVSI